MLRARFKGNLEDYRPIHWPVKHPFWCSGFDDTHSTIISYADDEQYIYDNWPEAEDLEVTEVDGYTFTDRFKKPEWFADQEAEALNKEGAK